MRAALAVLLLAVALSGCLGDGQGESGPNGPAASGAAAADPETGLPNNESSLPTLGPAVDPWLPNETERVLFEGDVEAGTCDGLLGVTYVPGGCAYIQLPEGALIPEGTAVLRVEADASEALKNGEYLFFLYTGGRDTPEEANGEATSEKLHTWSIALAPADWDPASRSRSAAGMGYWSTWDGQGVLVGAVGTKIVAERDPSWRPTPPVDHWSLPSLHRMPQPGVIGVHDENRTYEQRGTVKAQTQGRDEEFVTAQGRVPTGAVQVVVGATWGEIRGCATGFSCSVRIDTRAGGWFYGGYSQHPPSEVGPRHVLYTFSVPDDVEPDADMPNASLSFFPYAFNQCPEPSDTIGGIDCKRTYTDVSFDVRLVAEAWHDEPDLDAFKARLGVA